MKHCFRLVTPEEYDDVLLRRADACRPFMHAAGDARTGRQARPPPPCPRPRPGLSLRAADSAAVTPTVQVSKQCHRRSCLRAVQLSPYSATVSVQCNCLRQCNWLRQCNCFRQCSCLRQCSWLLQCNWL